MINRAVEFLALVCVHILMRCADVTGSTYCVMPRVYND